MSLAAWLAFLAGGAVGAPSRYLLDGYIQSNTDGAYPWGTFTINAAGSFMLGVLTGLALKHGLSPTTKIVLGTGFCGAFTTFSTFSVETDLLIKDGHPMTAAAYVASTLVVGLLCAWLGVIVGRLLPGSPHHQLEHT